MQTENALEDEGIAAILDAVRRFGPDVKAYRSVGMIRAELHPNGELLIFNYTPKAVFERQWGPVERVSRGLVVNWREARVVARPWAKFFNLNEQPETMVDALPAGPIEATVKLDGSLGISYFDGQDWAITTRGSFVSAQAQWATQYLRVNHRLNDALRDLTLLFEIVFPENRVILDYGSTEALYLIGARRVADGYDLSHAELAALAQRYGFPLVPAVAVAGLEDVVRLAEAATGEEGWVVRFRDGLRVKVKTAEYLRLAKLIIGFTPQRVRDLLLEHPEAWESYVRALPDEFHREARALAATMQARVDVEAARLRGLLAGALAAPLRASRKDFALAVRGRYLAESKYLFALADGKPIEPLLLRDLDLSTLELPPELGLKRERLQDM